MKRINLLLTLALPVLLSQNAQAQAASRLVGIAHYTNNGAVFIPSDSSFLTYSGVRGGDLTHTLKFDNETTLLYTPVDSAYSNEYNYLQSFDANNNLISSTTQYWEGSAWLNSTKTLYFYNPANNDLVTKVFQTWGGSNWVNVSNDSFTYNAANQLFSDQYQSWNGVIFTPVSEKVYYYDASSNQTQEVDERYNSSLGSFVYSSEYTYAYSTGNQLISKTYSVYDGSSTFVPVNQYINTYDSTGDLTNQLYQTYNTSTGAYVPDTLRTYSNFTNHLPMLENDQVWDTAGTGFYNNARQYTYTYNSNNQLTSSVGESWNIAGFYEYANGDPMNNYYYQSYDSTTSVVKNVVLNGGNANIYPVPATNTLHVDINWTMAQTATIAIYDMQGRMLNNVAVPFGTQYSSTLSVADLANGIYVLNISGTQGQIVKQIVVAH
jgi:hypothetical protein